MTDVDVDRVLHLAGEIAKPFEGLVLHPYHCPAGYPTIGYGHLLSREKHADLDQWEPLTHEEAEALLHQDMTKALVGALRHTLVAVTDGQLAALADFCYNLGIGAYQRSTLRNVINQGYPDEAPEQFRRWVYAGGRRLRGLVLRRGAEVDMGELWERLDAEAELFASGV